MEVALEQVELVEEEGEVEEVEEDQEEEQGLDSFRQVIDML